jgi:hypothetical protein
VIEVLRALAGQSALERLAHQLVDQSEHALAHRLRLRHECLRAALQLREQVLEARHAVLDRLHRHTADR